MTMQLNIADAQRGFQRLRDGSPAAITRALDRSIDSAKTAMVKVVSADLGLKSSEVRERIWKTAGTRDGGVQFAQLWANPERIPLIEFGATGPEPSRGQGRGVTVRSAGAVNMKGHYPNAFIAKMRSGHRGVFIRLGPSTSKSAGAWSKNLPVMELRLVSIVRVFIRHVNVGLARGYEQLAKNLQHEIRYAMRAAA